MPQATYIALWIDPAVDQLYEIFQQSFEAVDWRIVKSTSSEDGLRRLTFDDPQVDLVLVDAQTIGERNYAILDLIRQMDPDVPIIVVTDNPKSDLHLAVGRANASVIAKKELAAKPTKTVPKLLNPIAQRVRSITSYDIDQRKLANQVADTYEAFEAERPGTVAYWLFEEELILDILRTQEQESLTRPIKVLDIGCGTGRFARAILKASERAQVTCVDFSGRMLFKAADTLDEYLSAGRCTLNRALAEHLPYNYQDFDLVILGFGFPCYSPTRPVLAEVSRVLRNDGLLFASVYNHQALAYERWTGTGQEVEPERPISTWIDRERGLIWIPSPEGNRKVNARTYTTSQFARELRQSDFKVAGYLSFPVLYSVFACSEIQTQAEDTRRADCYNNRDFSFGLYNVDRKLIRHLKDKGFYSVFVASKTENRLSAIAQTLHLHTVATLEP